MSDVQPIDLDDLQRVAVKVRELTDDNWLADMVEIAAAEIARLREENRLLIEDRSRFPDKPDGIGRIIAAHNANREAKITDLENRFRDSLSEITRLREERRWVSVGERLPEDEEWVDVAGEWGDFVGWYDSVKWHNLFDDDPGEVTHWKKRTPGPEGKA